MVEKEGIFMEWQLVKLEGGCSNGIKWEANCGEGTRTK
jgi:hypothetical protein